MCAKYDNEFKSVIKTKKKKIKGNIENIVISMKNLEINQISTQDNPFGVDMPLNK